MLHARDILYWYSITNHKSCIIHTPVESSTRAGTSTRYKDLVLKVGGDCRLWGPVSGFRMHWHSAIGKPSYLVLGLQVHTEDNYFEIRVLQYRYRTCFVYVLRWGRTIERYSQYSTCSMEYGVWTRVTTMHCRVAGTVSCLKVRDHRETVVKTCQAAAIMNSWLQIQVEAHMNACHSCKCQLAEKIESRKLWDILGSPICSPFP